MTLTNSIGDLVTSLDAQCKNLRSSMASLVQSDGNGETPGVKTPAMNRVI